MFVHFSTWSVNEACVTDTGVSKRIHVAEQGCKFSQQCKYLVCPSIWTCL